MRVNADRPGTMRNELEIRKIAEDIINSIPASIGLKFDTSTILFKRLGPTEILGMETMKELRCKTIFADENIKNGILKINLPGKKERSGVLLASNGTNVIVMEYKQDDIPQLDETWEQMTGSTKLGTDPFDLDVPEEDFRIRFETGRKKPRVTDVGREPERREDLMCKMMYNLRTDESRVVIIEVEDRLDIPFATDVLKAHYLETINEIDKMSWLNHENLIFVKQIPSHIRTTADLAWFIGRIFEKNCIPFNSAVFKHVDESEQVQISVSKAMRMASKILRCSFQEMNHPKENINKDMKSIRYESISSNELLIRFNRFDLGLSLIPGILNSRNSSLTKICFGDLQPSVIDFMPIYRYTMKLERSIRIAYDEEIVEFDNWLRHSFETGYDKGNMKFCQFRVVEICDNRSETVEIGIEGWPAEMVKDRFEELRKILEPITIDCDAELFYGLGEAYVNHVVASLREKVVIDIDRFNNEMHVFGVKTLEALEQILMFEAMKSKIEIKAVMNVEGPYFNEIIRQYINIATVKKIAEATNSKIEVDKGHKLIFEGSATAFEDVSFILNEVNKKIYERICQPLGLNISLTCPVCMEEVNGNYYRLEKCGHSYCRECLNGLIKSVLDSNNFPCKCVYSDCGSLIIPADLEKIILGGQNRIKTIDSMKASRFYHKMMGVIVMKSNGTIKTCPQIDCKGYMTVSKRLVEKVKKCKICKYEYCPKCLSESHPGTCEEFKKIHEERAKAEIALASYKEEKMKDGTLKACPGCNVLMEKNEGCNHMICDCCKTHFCWLCNFKNDLSGPVYDHMNAVHGGFYT